MKPRRIREILPATYCFGAESIRQLAREKFGAILPFHSSPLFGEAGEKLTQYLDRHGITHEDLSDSATEKSSSYLL